MGTRSTLERWFERLAKHRMKPAALAVAVLATGLALLIFWLAHGGEDLALVKWSGLMLVLCSASALTLYMLAYTWFALKRLARES